MNHDDLHTIKELKERVWPPPASAAPAPLQEAPPAEGSRP